MFKAIEIESDQEIILLDTRGTTELATLREWSQSDRLVCQECRKPVNIRAGEIKRKHFAHKRRADCPYGSESPLLLHTRAVLYSFLKARFGTGVTLEKRLEDTDLPRPVDCWVEHEKGTFAYWILDSQVRQYEQRDILLSTFRQLQMPITWIFTSTFLDVDARAPEHIHLSTTEREFMQKTYLDVVLQGTTLHKGETLHYLNAETEELTTYRSLTLIHSPQLYHGRRFHNALSEIKVASLTGELAHPGERERSQQVREQKRIREEQQRQAEEARLRAWEAAEKRTQEGQARGGGSSLPLQRAASPVSSEPPTQPLERIGICKFCKEETSEWIAWDGDGMCRCRKCYREKNLF
jgi:hypothetical protein